MMKVWSISVLAILLFVACENDTIEDPYPGPDFEIRMSTSVGSEPMELYRYYENVAGDSMSFEQIMLFLSDISLIKTNGDSVLLSEIELFDMNGPSVEKGYDVEPGTYSGLVYHVGVPKRLNGMDNPDFMISIYGPDSPLNISTGMYWAWATGYRFMIYEGRLDTTPDVVGDVPSFYSIHLGKDTLYTQIQVDQPFTIVDGDTRIFNIDLDLAKCIYDETDTLNLRIPAESQWHGEDNELGFRFQHFLEQSFEHSFE